MGRRYDGGPVGIQRGDRVDVRWTVVDPLWVRGAREHLCDHGPMDDFDCPRCHTTVQEEFYGPCTACRSQLRSTVGAEAREVAVGAYEPKMNVTPNAVALKE